MVLNLIGLDFGFTLALPTIVIPSVTNITSNNNELNPDETLYMTDEEASWLCNLMLNNIFIEYFIRISIFQLE